MDENKQIDEFDKMFYDYFKNDQEVPQRIHDAIYSAFDRRRQKRKRISVLKRVAMIVISFGVMTTGIVFADDIINFITSLFTNSTDGIESAVQNGYVQTVDMEYVYDNDIGVKVDNVILDDTNLDISFIYNYQGNEKIDSLELYEYTIKDENDNILYELTDNTKNEFAFPLYVSRYNESVLIENNMYKDSIIYTSKDFPNIQNIQLEIRKFKLLHNENSNIISGNWNIKINLDRKITNSNNEIYSVSNNEYLNNSKIELTETALKIKLDFKTRLDEQIFNNRENIILMDSNDKCYYYKFSDLKNIDNTSILYLEYDISKYFNNINKLDLFIKTEAETITLNFVK